MNFIDIIKNSVLERLNGSLSLWQILLGLLFSLLAGVFILFIYKKTMRKVAVGRSFTISLLLICAITATMVLTITSNLALSLGMVGALSIVRFRTAIKEPMDIAFLFWAIAAGIVLAAGMIPLAVFGSLIIGVVLLLFLNRKAAHDPYIAVVSCEGAEAEKAAQSFIAQHTEKAVIKSKTVQDGRIELNYEVRLKSENTDFVSLMAQQEGVRSAVLVSYNGDYLG